MDQDIINGINTVLYYYEQYQNGDEEAIIALEEIANGIKSASKLRVKNYLMFSFLTILQKIKILITDIYSMEDENYKELLSLCKDDLNYYYEISKYLSEYAKVSLKTGNYENIDDIFILSIKVSTILTNITEYYKQISTMLSYTYSTINYVYPDSIKRLSLTTKTEINDIVNKIKQKDS